LHYANELSLISSRSSALIRRLLDATPALSLPCDALPSDSQAAYPQPQLNALGFQPSDVRRRSAMIAEPSRPSLDHAAVMRNLAPVLKRIAAGSAAVSVFTPATLPSFALSVEALERITVNLVRNAAEAIRLQREADSSSRNNPADSGEIRISLVVGSGRVQLTVDDNGPGLPPATAAAFMRPSPLPPSGGRGHGHRILHDLVTTSGGQISIRVRPGKGSTFCLRWPLAESRFAKTQIAASTGLPSSQLTPQETSVPC
jgi:signal transduction histidine kinase